tara:strand:+ start:738 stop:950 length:213 start_codon:yes stop_codon:yes gene_type:complete
LKILNHLIRNNNLYFSPRNKSTAPLSETGLKVKGTVETLIEPMRRPKVEEDLKVAILDFQQIIDSLHKRI